MKSDRFKKPATLSRFARQMTGPAMALAHEAGLPLMDLTIAPARFDVKNLLRADAHDGEWQGLFSRFLLELIDSPLAAALIRRAQKKGWSLGILAKEKSSGDYFYTLDMQSKTLWLDHGGFSPLAIERTPHCREALVGSLVRGLRDIGHEIRLGAYESGLRPDAVLMMERARSADIESVCVLIAWELRGAGFPDLWRHLLGSEDGDIALTFGYSIEKNPKSLYDGKALAASFLRWYIDPARLNSCDHASLEMLDNLLAQRAAGESWGRLSFTAEDARDLSILPDGLAYLKDEARELVGAPQYQALPDAINEAHLFQIAHDLIAMSVEGVPFRSAALARRIFPTAYPQS